MSFRISPIFPFAFLFCSVAMNPELLKAEIKTNLPPLTNTPFGKSFPHPVSFQVNPDQVKVFSQRFEYKVLSPFEIRVGHVLVNFKDFSAKLSSNREGGVSVRFEWPSGLIHSGEIALKDHSGSAIIMGNVHQENSKIIRSKTDLDQNLVNEVSRWFNQDLDPGVLEKIQYLPFLSLCLYFTEGSTSLELCSDELYPKTMKGGLSLLPKTGKKDSLSVSVNGERVGPQGYILLNDPSKSTTFEAQRSSGGALRIQAQYTPVQFLDLSRRSNGDKKFLYLRAKGLRPFSDRSLLSDPPTWTAQVPYSMPILYLRGNGGIPFRQEFFIKSDPPDDLIRPYLHQDSRFQTYSSEISYLGRLAPNSTIESEDQQSTVRNQTNSQFEWDVKDLEKGLTNTRTALLKFQNQLFRPAVHVERGFPWRVNLAIDSMGGAQRLGGDLHILYHLESLFGIESTYLCPSIGLTYNKYLSAQSLKFDTFLLDLGYRLQSGLQFANSYFGLSLTLGQSQTQSSTISHVGIGGFSHHPAPRFLRWTADYVEAQVRLLSSYSSLQIRPLIGVSQKHHFFYELGAKQASNQTEALLGLGWTTLF